MIREWKTALRSIYVLAGCAALLSTPSSVGAAAADDAVSGTFPAMISVVGGTFQMGRDEAEHGESDELPRHEVTLSPYSIGRYEVTNAEYCAVLNWALEGGRLMDFFTRPYRADSGDVYTKGRLLKRIGGETDIVFRGGQFETVTRDGIFMDNHPVVEVTWYGAVAFTAWLSEIRGLDPAYNLVTWQRVVRPTAGYRLPTEAEWERAAAWTEDGTHRRFAFEGDAIEASRATFAFNNPMGAIGLASFPQTTPVGYFNGSLAGTVDSASPVGCYDMSGNAHEWCDDWFREYSPGPKTDPRGAPAGDYKIVRGGGWSSVARNCRSVNRGWSDPNMTFRTFGFRIARSR